MENQNTSIEQQYKTSVIIWAAILFSQFLLLVVIFFAKPEVFRFDAAKPILGDKPAMTIMFAALAIMNVAMSFVLRQRSVKKAIDTQTPALVQQGIVVGAALCEAVSLLGVAMAFAFSYQYFFVWFVVGILGMLLHFPKRDDFIAAGYKR